MAEEQSFVEMVKEMSTVPIAMKRAEQADFVEFVIRKEHLGQLTDVIESYFGPPLKPAGRNATREESSRVAEVGGVWENQTLYFSDRDGRLSYAMFWPWGDGVLITVKIIKR